mgnify:CR=1 FL=1|tara:strand:+ start:281 stop:499 length:219 start_codon:yes stop_codon:yes gene_type:complete
MNKKLYEYNLVVLGRQEDGDTKPMTPRNYYFTAETAQEHNKQYALYNVPRKLVKVKGGEVIEKPEWWSGNIK